MAKGNDIAIKVKEFVKANETKFKSDNFKKLLLANDKYNQLIEKGIVKKRGYTLRGIEDSHLFHIRINS